MTTDGSVSSTGYTVTKIVSGNTEFTTNLPSQRNLGNNLNTTTTYSAPGSGLYYCQTRYYDPVVGRFINADGLVQTPAGGVLAGNMYAYCENNPVNFDDQTGMWKQVSGGWQAQSGDTLWGLAVQLYGNGSKWTSFGFSRDPKALQVGEVIKTGSSGGGTSTTSVYVRDVTGEVNRALSPYLTMARDVGRLADAMPLYEPYRYGMFAMLVMAGGAWDVKLKNSWESTIGTPFPGRGALISYRGIVMTPENLGNFTYGLLGAAFGFSYQMLINGSIAAAKFPSTYSGWQNEFGDWGYVTRGYLNYYF